jgi:hypothetical protein
VGATAGHLPWSSSLPSDGHGKIVNGDPMYHDSCSVKYTVPYPCKDLVLWVRKLTMSVQTTRQMISSHHTIQLTPCISSLR